MPSMIALLVILGVAAVGLIILSALDSLTLRRAVQEESERVRAQEAQTSATVKMLLFQCRMLMSANLSLMAENEGVRAMVAKELTKNPEMEVPVGQEGLCPDPSAEPDNDEGEGQFEGVMRHTAMGDE
jgi:hypothetical protein